MSSSTRRDQAPAPSTLHALERHPRFVDLEDIGDGAYGSVRRCWDATLRCTRAVKIFKEQDAAAQDVSEACLREIAFQSFLTDSGAPGIVPLLDVLFGSEGQVSVLMPCFEMDLGTAVDDARFVSWHHCRPVLKDAFHALSYLHSFEPPLMHRDLKPENILLDPVGRAYLTDFGFMRFVRDGVTFKTQNLHCKGSNQRATQTYSAPEMLQEGKTHDERVDVWAMGVVALELSRNARLEARTDRTARRTIKKLRETKWACSADVVDSLLAMLLQELPAERCSASEVLAHSALRSPECAIECSLERSAETPKPPCVCSQESRGTPTPIQVMVAECMKTLDYRMPQTFYAACAYVGDALESVVCGAASSTTVLCAVATAGKLYEHEYWDTEDLPQAEDLSPAELASFQKHLLQHRRGRLLVPFPCTTMLYEERLPAACAARKQRCRRNCKTKKRSDVVMGECPSRQLLTTKKNRSGARSDGAALPPHEENNYVVADASHTANELGSPKEDA